MQWAIFLVVAQSPKSLPLFQKVKRCVNREDITTIGALDSSPHHWKDGHGSTVNILVDVIFYLKETIIVSRKMIINSRVSCNMSLHWSTYCLYYMIIYIYTHIIIYYIYNYTEWGPSMGKAQALRVIIYSIYIYIYIPSTVHKVVLKKTSFCVTSRILNFHPAVDCGFAEDAFRLSRSWNFSSSSLFLSSTWKPRRWAPELNCTRISQS